MQPGIPSHVQGMLMHVRVHIGHSCHYFVWFVSFHLPMLPSGQACAQLSIPRDDEKNPCK